MKKIKVCDRLAYIILFVIVLTVSPFLVPKVFGFQAYGILSNSMEPEIMTGSLVYVKACNAESIEVQDIITFETSVKNKNAATHRVVAKNEETKTLITKGDHNEDVDTTAVRYDNVIGKVVKSIPVLGYMYQFVVSGLGMAIYSFLLIMVCLLWYLVYIWKKAEKKKSA